MLRVFPISLTGAASRWLRNEPTGSIKTWEDLKTKFLNKYCPPGRDAKKMEEINNFQQESDETLYQAWERFKELLMKCPQHYLTEMQEAIQEMAEYSQKWHNGTSRSRSTETFDGLVAIQAQLNNLGREIKKVNDKVYAAQVGCEQCKGPHYTKDCPLKEEGKTLEEAYYTQSMEDTLSKFIGESAKRHEENSNLIKEIQASTDAAIRNQGASIKTLEIQIEQMSKVLQESGFGSLPSLTETNPRDQVKSILTTIEADSCPIRSIGSSKYAVSTGQNRTLMNKTRQTTIAFPRHLNGYYCEEKEGSYGPKFLDSKASHIDNSILERRRPSKNYVQNLKNQSKTGQYRTQDWKSTAKAGSTAVCRGGVWLKLPTAAFNKGGVCLSAADSSFNKGVFVSCDHRRKRFPANPKSVPVTRSIQPSTPLSLTRPFHHRTTTSTRRHHHHSHHHCRNTTTAETSPLPPFFLFSFGLINKGGLFRGRAAEESRYKKGVFVSWLRAAEAAAVCKGGRLVKAADSSF
nr:hypothetical protein [Tanacetum cinerariifolium]